MNRSHHTIDVDNEANDTETARLKERNRRMIQNVFKKLKINFDKQRNEEYSKNVQVVLYLFIAVMLFAILFISNPQLKILAAFLMFINVLFLFIKSVSKKLKKNE